MAVPSYVKPGFTGVQRTHPIVPYGGITVDRAGNRNLNAGGNTNQQATEGARKYKEALGLPSFEDLFNKFGGGTGTREFGNAGCASEGADYLRSELDAQKGNIAEARRGIRNPTKTLGFKNVMRLTNERLGQAAEGDRRLAAEAASRRGFVGGYSPDAAAQGQREALALAGGEAAAKEREAQQALFGGESDLYRGQLGAYSDLTKTAAELPTKWLDSFSNLLGGGGGFGDIFGTASRNVMFDTSNTREDDARLAAAARDRGTRLRTAGNVGGSV